MLADLVPSIRSSGVSRSERRASPEPAAYAQDSQSPGSGTRLADAAFS